MQQPGKETRSVETAIADSDKAVFDLLESLLQEVDEIPPSEGKTKTTTKSRSETQTDTKTKTKAKVKVEATLPLNRVSDDEMLAAVRLLEEYDLDIDETMPEWTRSSQQCLLFDVEGTEVAIPLVVLQSIAVWDSEALSIPIQPDWHLGVIQHRGENIVIIDTARLIMPEKITQSPEERRKKHGSHYLVINGHFALSCNDIKETVLVTRDMVKWRSQRSNRPWAVGVIIDRLCVLMDTEELVREIEQK